MRAIPRRRELRDGPHRGIGGRHTRDRFDIAGYRDVVRNGVDGILVPPGDPDAIASALRQMWQQPARRAAMARAAVRDVGRFAWPGIAHRVLEAYEDATATPAPSGLVRRAAVRVGMLPADLEPAAPARRLPSLEPKRATSATSWVSHLRRAGLLAVSLAVVALAALAIRKLGWDHLTSALLQANPTLVVVGLAVMCSTMVLRAVSWHAALRVGLADTVLRFRDVTRALFIGVLISSVLPASLGEPSRAAVIVRRSGRGWEILPAVLGTLMSQALLNVAALTILGAVTFGSVSLFVGHGDVLVAGAAGVALAVLLVVVAPTILRHTAGSSWLGRVQSFVLQLRSGLAVFRHPGSAAIASSAQLAAWGLQCVAVYVLLAALHLSQQTGFLGAVAVLFAVNVTLLLPITPGDIGVFQAAAAAVLHAGWQVPYTDGIAFGVVLQGVELAAALLMGVPALLLEGMSWRQITQGPPASTAGPLAASSAATGTLPAAPGVTPPAHPAANGKVSDPSPDWARSESPQQELAGPGTHDRTPGSAAGASLLRAHNEEP